MKIENNTINIERKDKTIFFSLNRPEVHNAMNEEMITELTTAFNSINDEVDVRAIVLRGTGKSFCAGADLNYMKSIAGFGLEENIEDGKKLAALFKSIYDCPIPTIAVVHGAAFGGANGLLAACDFVIAQENSIFAFSEVKLGIAPATIAPFVIKRIGEFGAKELMLTGKKFDAITAAKWKLVNTICAENKMEETLNELLKQFVSSAPAAVMHTKVLIKNILNSRIEDSIEYTSNLIANLRASNEGQEGMSAFLEKRKPKWMGDE